MWGFTPFYFNAMDRLRVEEIVAHRIVWCVLFLILVLTVARQWPAVWRALTNRKVLLIFLTNLKDSLGMFNCQRMSCSMIVPVVQCVET